MKSGFGSAGESHGQSSRETALSELRKQPLSQISAEADRIERITVCTRPFRAQGPRIEAERIGEKHLVHHYGHGGAGWSLSWGSAARVLPLVLGGGPGDVAVIGCGAIGIVTAITLQRAGLRVRIYARDLPPAVRSSRATGLWSPDSRIALTGAMGGAFAGMWETMARQSWTEFQRLAGAPDGAVALHSRFLLSELPPDQEIARRHREDAIGFAHLEERLDGLYPPSVDLEPGEHPFPVAHCRRTRTLRFNITALSESLLSDFRARGGEIKSIEFHTAADLHELPEPTVVNCTGWGAAGLFGDGSLTPVRGQIGWLPAQPEIGWSLQWNKLSVVSRADGLVVQLGASSDETGWNDPGESPDPGETYAALRLLRNLQARTPG